jgi:hypothetical protein
MFAVKHGQDARATLIFLRLCSSPSRALAFRDEKLSETNDIYEKMN